jgi:hypothetical protein
MRGLKSSVILTAAVLLFPIAVGAAAFDCFKAHSTAERLICGDPQLSKMDDDLAVLYGRAKASAPDLAAFKKTNTDARDFREKNCADRACLLSWYHRRNLELAGVLNHAQIARGGVPMGEAPVPQPATPAAPSAEKSDTNWAFYLVGAAVLWLVFGRKKSGRKSAAPVAKRAASLAGNRITSTIQVGAQTSKPEARSGKPMRAVWIVPGKSIDFAGVTLPGGMLYVGSTLSCANGGSEPAQIDPQLPIDSKPVDIAERLFGYWPRYSELSPAARRGYVTWLEGGRSDPKANIGYVFLFYYGLERRIFVDAPSDPAAKAEIAQIIAEIERLQRIYSNGSFQRYSSELIGFLGAQTAGPAYRNTAPPATQSRGMPLLMKIGLGQSAVDGRPVPADWALAWARSDPNMHLPTAAARCGEQFDARFRQVYGKEFGEGLRLAVNRTKLKISYRPASGAFASGVSSIAFAQLPDVTTVVTPVKKLQAIIDESAAELEAYSRFIGRHVDKAQSLEATVLLPPTLWSDAIKGAVNGLNTRIGTGMIVIKLGELVNAFGGSAAPTRERLKDLFQVLQGQNVGVEPDVLAGAKTPKSEDSVVLFRLGEPDTTSSVRTDSNYEAVAVMLDLAITLANADGRISGREVRFLNRQVDAWAHVGPRAQRRLRARLRLGIVYPPTLGSLKTRVEPLPADTKRALAKLLSALALADGKLSTAAVKHLEKMYHVLGIATEALYSELHAASAAAEGPAPAAGPSRAADSSARSGPAPLASAAENLRAAKPAVTFVLDAARIAALQLETERVTALLSKVFEEQESRSPQPAEEIQHVQERSAGLLGLDAEHSAFLRVLLSRPSWSRAELQDMAADMELMLDGALERVNEAALDTYDTRVAEGDDPIEVAQDLMESSTA